MRPPVDTAPRPAPAAARVRRAPEPSAAPARPARRAARWAWPAALAALFAIALGLRLWGLRHGLPYVYNVDEQAHFVPRAIGFFGHSFDPHYFVNPPAFTYLLHAIFAAWFGGGDGAARALSDDPAAVFTAARAASAALGALAAALLALAASRLLASRAAGLLAGALLAAAFLPVHYGHLALNDGPALAAVALGLLGAAGVLARGRRRDYLLAGAAVGLAAATKYTAGIVLVPLLAAAVVAAQRDGARATARGGGLALAAGLGAFLAANPYALLDAGAFLHGIGKQASAAGSTTKLGAAETSGHRYYLETLTWGFGWLPAAAAGAGALGTAWRDRRLALVLVPAPLLFWIWMGAQDRFFGRWLMPILPILCILAAWAALHAVRAVRRRRPGLAAPTAAAIAAALLAQGAAASIHNDLVLARADTRGLARAWLAARVPAGARIVAEPIVPDRWVAPWRAWPAAAPDEPAALLGPAAAAAGPGPRGAAAGLAARLAAGLAARRAIGGVPLQRLARSARIVGAEGYERGLSPGLIAAYRRAGACWVVTGSTQQGRAAAQPARVPGAVAYYRALHRTGRVAARFRPVAAGAPPPFDFDRSFNAQPLAVLRAGPEVTIFRLHGGRCGPAPGRPRR